MTVLAWADLPETDQREIRRLEKRHRLIRLHGAHAAELYAREEALREEREAWVERHGLSCFKCGSRFGKWVKGGRSRDGKLWVVCDRCVRETR